MLPSLTHWYRYVAGIAMVPMFAAVGPGTVDAACNFNRIMSEVRIAQETLHKFKDRYDRLQQQVEAFDARTRITASMSFSGPTNDKAVIKLENGWEQSLSGVTSVLSWAEWTVNRTPLAVDLAPLAAVVSGLKTASEAFGQLAGSIHGMETTADEVCAQFRALRQYRLDVIGKLRQMQNQHFCRYLWSSGRTLYEIRSSVDPLINLPLGNQGAAGCTGDQKATILRAIEQGPQLLKGIFDYHRGGRTLDPQDNCDRFVERVYSPPKPKQSQASQEGPPSCEDPSVKVMHILVDPPPYTGRSKICRDEAGVLWLQINYRVYRIISLSKSEKKVDNCYSSATVKIADRELQGSLCDP